MKVTKLVEESLEQYNECRNSDRYLLLTVWHRLGFKLTSEQRSIFMDMPSAETIRRVRQKIQEGGKYPATIKIKKERYMKSMILGQAAPVYKPEHIENILERAQLV